MRLSVLIDQLRSELEAARKPTAKATLSLEECELEICVEIEAGGTGELELKVLGTGVKIGGDAARTSSHKVRVKFSPLPAMPFAEQLAELKAMIELMKKEQVAPEVGNFLLSRYMPNNTQFVVGPPGAFGLPGGFAGSETKHINDTP
jgi:hypothetical protein